MMLPTFFQHIDTIGHIGNTIEYIIMQSCYQEPQSFVNDYLRGSLCLLRETSCYNYYVPPMCPIVPIVVKMNI
jgi:hypothetical protein